MTVERMIELLEIEKECVLRKANGECNRYCAGCDLLQDDTELHEMYTKAIALLKAQEPRVTTMLDITPDRRATGGDTVECTKVNCPMQAGTPTDNCGENCPWRTTAKTGDLISRKAAIEALSTPCDKRYRDGVWETCLDNIETVIMHIPAMNAAPVVHAHWIETKIPANTTGHGGVGQDKKNGWLCSNCRCAFDAKLLWCHNYCPNCGAKMDGE